MPTLHRDDYLGRTVSEAEAIGRDQGWVVRRLVPGQLITMELREDRLNLTYDEREVVTDVSVG